jgi:hypothetical protein
MMLQSHTVQHSALILSFYELAEAPLGKESKPGDRWYRCYHPGTNGQQPLHRVTPRMKSSYRGVLSYLTHSYKYSPDSIGLKLYLERYVPVMWLLYRVLEERGTPPSQLELDIITAKRSLQEPSIALYLEDLLQGANFTSFKVLNYTL